MERVQKYKTVWTRENERLRRLRLRPWRRLRRGERDKGPPPHGAVKNIYLREHDGARPRRHDAVSVIIAGADADLSGLASALKTVQDIDFIDLTREASSIGGAPTRGRRRAATWVPPRRRGASCRCQGRRPVGRLQRGPGSAACGTRRGGGGVGSGGGGAAGQDETEAARRVGPGSARLSCLAHTLPRTRTRSSRTLWRPQF